MLTTRAFSRSLPNVLRPNALTRRFHVQGPRAQYATRPSNLASKIWLRPDGTPRSKLKGFAIGFLSLSTIFTAWTMLNMIEELDASSYVIACLVHIQRCDMDFSSVNFNDPTLTMEYFKELCASFTDIPEKLIVEFFENISQLIQSPAEAGKEAVDVMRAASQEVHDILVGSKGRDPWETASEVVRKLDEAIVHLVDLVDDSRPEDEQISMLRHQRLKDKISKDITKSSDYEVVG